MANCVGFEIGKVAVAVVGSALSLLVTVSDVDNSRFRIRRRDLLAGVEG